jgi:DUF177 domain-containing protein
MRGHPLQVGVADLLRRPGNHRDEHLEAVLDDLAVTGSRVVEGEPAELDVRLESVNEGIVVSGTVRVPWEGECRRCLQPVRDTLEVKVFEVFEDEPVEGETSKLDIDRIDLEPLARETILLELPMAPLCQDDCAGLCPECGADRNTTDCGHTVETTDPRWAALGELKFDE